MCDHYDSYVDINKCHVLCFGLEHVFFKCLCSIIVVIVIKMTFAIPKQLLLQVTFETSFPPTSHQYGKHF